MPRASGWRLAEAAALLEGSPAVVDPSVNRADAILGLGLVALTRHLLGQAGPAGRPPTHAWKRIGDPP